MVYFFNCRPQVTVLVVVLTTAKINIAYGTIWNLFFKLVLESIVGSDNIPLQAYARYIISISYRR